MPEDTIKRRSRTSRRPERTVEGRWARLVLQGLVWTAAAAFAGLATTGVVLRLSGAVEAKAWHAALAVLRGTSDAVPRAELRRRDEELRRLRDIEKIKEPELIESWRKHGEEKRRFQERKKRESDTVKELADGAKAALRKITEAQRKLDADRGTMEERRLAWEAEDKAAASEKIRRIYRYMRPDEVARDLEQRMADGRPDEVAALLKGMSDRYAAEVLEAVPDAGRRLEIYRAMAGAPGAVGTPVEVP